MIRSILILLFILLPLHNNIYAGTKDPQTPDQKYVEYAIPFRYIGKLCGSYKDGSLFCSSAVAIDDHHILTAAHVVQNVDKCSVEFGDKKYFLSEVIIHKDFDPKKFGMADIAIAYSEESFDLDFYPQLYIGDDEEGKVCSISGYGITGTFLTGAKTYDDKRRAGSNRIDKIEADMLMCSPSRRNDEGYTSLEFLIASGDSGGGLFIDSKLAGINSCVLASDKNPNSSYTDESGHTRISKFADWIKKHKRR